jgi:NAD-dependent deacetylase
MKKICVLSGAGVSKESGIPTFRDSKDGLWHNYKIDEVASEMGLRKNPELVLNFYNERRKAVKEAVPNDGHYYLAKLQEKYEVNIFTQNIDDLHERAGSENVFHIHGDITKARSMKNEDNIIHIGYNDIKLGDLHGDGGQLRPHVVFFGEFICFEEHAYKTCANSDIVISVGTSLSVYPAAKLPSRYRRLGAPLYIVDPGEFPFIEMFKPPVKHIKKVASEGMKEVYDILMGE